MVATIKHPHVGFFPALPLANNLELGDWMVGTPPANVVWRSDRFKAGVALAGVYDWIYGYGLKSQAELLIEGIRSGTLEAQIVESGQIRLGKPFWKDPAPYIRNSPIFHVESIDAPLLLLHGDLDLGVTGLAGAERMYNALARAGKKPALVRYWGEGHVAQSEWAIRDQWSRITRWFNAYLKPDVQR